MNRKKKKSGADGNGRLRDQLRKAAEGLKEKSERAKSMNEETKKEQDAAQETQSPEVPETQSLEDDAQALAAELGVSPGRANQPSRNAARLSNSPAGTFSIYFVPVRSARPMAVTAAPSNLRTSQVSALPAVASSRARNTAAVWLSDASR